MGNTIKQVFQEVIVIRALINYFRSCFCKHDWDLICDTVLKFEGKPHNKMWIYRCKKCGYHNRIFALNEYKP